ncbi:AraC family transcriptional regulator [Alteromonas portus]|uniref:AraC family transcriptional regulator n=1 Tax=Alteromonas portus TaxID=2565549 RepID=A0A4U0ZAM8_9ALTE|nr:AraC family transcriptional regulator [Alteromonas portus]TKB00725.1 AraC family transcriptional regulator [Alteromonas portus]
MPYAPSIGLSGIDYLIREYGQDSDNLLIEVGIDPEVLVRAESQIDGQLFIDAIEKLARKLNQRYLGIQLAKIQGATVLGPLWFLLRNSATVQESIDSLLLNYPSHTDISYFSTQLHSRGLILTYDINPQIGGNHTQAIDLGLAIWCLSYRRYIDPKWQPKAIYLRTTQPYDSNAYHEIFGESIYFDQEINGIVISDDELKIPIKQASPLRKQYYKRQRQQYVDLNPRSTIVQVEHVIHANLTSHCCNLNFVALCLGLKPRTLQLHLQKQGVKFSELLNKAKLALAIKYLTHSNLSATEISQRLHFNDSATFTRFIKRHSGKTPKQHRLKCVR